MIKVLIVYFLSFTVLFLVVQFSQEFILNQLNIAVRFNLWDTNLFFAIASLIICLHFQFFSSIKKLQPQLGFIYLPTLFIKGIIFFVAFRSSIFSLDSLKTAERLNLLIPFLLFLGLEVFFIVKIIRKTEV
jgi:hypothetical protein